MFPSLRAKLIVAFVLVTSLTVILSAAGMLLLLRHRETSQARERLAQFGNTVAEQVASRIAANWRTDTLSVFLQQRSEELGLRFVLIDVNKNTIVTDTAGRLTGQPADQLTRIISSQDQSKVTGYGFTTWQGQLIGQVIRPVRQDYQVLMLVPEGQVSGAWRDLLPRVAISGGIALAAAIVVAYFLSRSIARPVVEVTRASEEMARGRYDQRIPVQGRDEIGRLARTFNFMTHQVARSHQTMRDLIGNVAHELKTPLTSVQGYSQALIDGAAATPEEASHAARVINDEAERMRRLVEDLLYLSRLESGQLRIERAPVRVPALLATAAERVRWQLRDSGRELRVQMPVDLPTIQGDVRRLEQVLANLLDNAMRYTPEGGCITLAAQWSLDSVTISVHNTGSYIPPQHLPRIFERFYQVDPSRARDGRLHSVGLGLSIAREIVLAHGGSITAHSDQRTGTEFHIVLPAGRSRAADEALWRPPAVPAPTPAPAPAPRSEPAA